MLVAQNATSGSQGTFHRLDLTTGMVTNINYTLAFGENGAWDVAIGSNGLALATTDGSGSVPLRQIDLAINAISIRSDAPGHYFNGEVEQDTQTHRSADGTRLGVFDRGIFTYSATANTFGPSLNTGFSSFGLTVGAVNRNGSLLARIGILYTAPTLSVVNTFSAINNNGVAFNAASDILYGFNSSASPSQIIAYSTQTFAELFRFTIREFYSGTGQFGPGMLVASADGKWLALSTGSGIRLFRVSGPTPPPTRVVSRKLHGGVPFDIDLPVLGDPGIECRSGGASNTYQIVFTFPTAVTFTSASITDGTGSVSSAIGSGTSTITVNITGVTNVQKITFTLFGVNDGTSTGDVGVAMGVLIGDTNGDGSVNAGDTTQTRSRSGQTTNATNFRSDVTTDGVVNSGDTTAVRAKSGTSLP